MQLSPEQLKQMISLYQEGKFWVPFLTGAWFIFSHLSKAKDKLTESVNFVKEIKTNDLHHLQMGLDALHNGLKEQTGAIVTELRELRADIRAKN